MIMVHNCFDLKTHMSCHTQRMDSTGSAISWTFRQLIVGLLGCIGCTFLYVLRSNISVAIIAMVEPIQVIHMFNNTGTQTDVCFNTYNISTKSRPTYHGPKYPWNESAQGLVLGAYFYGYTVTQFCGSYADKFGAKWMTGL
ncbi:unnamed protein product, partial [Medioppia subpectinata]